MSKQVLEIVLVFVCCCPLLGQAEDLPGPRFTPAAFGTGPGLLSSQLECPAWDGGSESAGVFCQAKVLEDGSSADGSSGCFGPRSQNRKYAHATENAIQKARFVPATVNGEPVAVFFPFRVLYVYGDGGCTVMALPNHGYQQKEFGSDYFAPQEIVSDGGWFARSGFFGHPRGKFGYFRGNALVFRFSVAVSITGEPGDARVEEQGVASRQEVGASLRAISTARFIPGFVDGQAYPMRYYEFLYVRLVN